MIPDGFSEVAVGILAGILGFLARAVMELKSRVAVLERGHDALDAMDAKIDRLCVDMADLKATMRERLPGARALNTAHGEDRHG